MSVQHRVVNFETSFLICPNGDVHTLEAPKDGEHYSLDELQAMVEGLIEPIPCPFSRHHVCYANEEGLLQNLPYNEVASNLFCRNLVGNVVGIREEYAD